MSEIPNREPSLPVLWDAVMGYFDHRANRWVPGIRDDLVEIKSRQKWDRIIGGMVAFILVARALGVPTDEVWKVIVRIFGA